MQAQRNRRSKLPAKKDFIGQATNIPTESTETALAVRLVTQGQPHLGNVAHKVELGLLHAQGRDDVWNIRQRKGGRQLHRSAVTPAPEPSPTATTMTDVYIARRHQLAFGVERTPCSSAQNFQF